MKRGEAGDGSLGSISDKLFKDPALFLFILTLVIYTICLNSLWATDHTTSFLELAWAISNNHSFALGKVMQSVPQSCNTNPIEYTTGIFCTVDDLAHNGFYYSALAPGTPVLMLPFTSLGFFLSGGFSIYSQPLVYSEFFIALTNSFATVLVYKISRLYFGETTSAFLALAYAFSTISWPFATFIFQSDPSTAFDLLAVYSALKLTRKESSGGSGWKYILASGLALSTAVTIDYPNIILVPILLFYLIFVIHEQNGRIFAKNLATFLLSASAGIVLLGGYNYFSFGSPFVTSEQLYQNGAGLLASYSQPLDLGLLLNLFTPYRGLFVYSPILALGVLGFYMMLKSKLYDKEGILLLAIFCAILFPYSKWLVLDAGLSYGPRFIIPCIPFLLIPAGFVIDGQRRRVPKIIAYGLYSIGVVTNGIAALTSALAQTESSWLRSPFLDESLPRFLNGTSMESWILNSWGHEAYLIASGLIIAVALVAPIVFYLKLRSYDSSPGKPVASARPRNE